MANDWYGKSMMEDQEFEEEDVWGVIMKEKEESDRPHNNDKMKKKNGKWTSHEGARMIPSGGRVPQQQQSSAPMGIPDWSKIYNNNNNKEKSKGPDDACCYEAGDEIMVPPHEYIIARRQAATSHIASSSMCEGVGRTLKGRDLSKLRNAILTKTGFLE